MFLKVHVLLLMLYIEDLNKNLGCFRVNTFSVMVKNVLGLGIEL